MVLCEETRPDVAKQTENEVHVMLLKSPLVIKFGLWCNAWSCIKWPLGCLDLFLCVGSFVDSGRLQTVSRNDFKKQEWG